MRQKSGGKSARKRCETGPIPVGGRIAACEDRSMVRIFQHALTVVLFAAASTTAHAAGADAPKLDGAALGLVWLLPFAAILGGIALGPLVAAHAWHAHYGKYSAACAFAFLVPCALVFGADVAT